MPGDIRQLTEIMWSSILAVAYLTLAAATSTSTCAAARTGEVQQRRHAEGYPALRHSANPACGRDIPPEPLNEG